LTGEPIRVLVVDGHQTFAELLGLAIGRQPDLRYVGHAATGAQALRLVDELRPDVVLMDADLPDADGIATTERLRARHPDIRVVVLTASTEPPGCPVCSPRTVRWVTC
jgi:DNA-binding NarL/FixJ family response regulator